MNERGRAAEDAALALLQAAGLKLVARNWRCPGGELDLVMQDGAGLVFVEVRARSHDRFGGAAASLTPAKLGRVRLAAGRFLQTRHGVTPPCRFDAVLIDGQQEPVWLRDIDA